MCSKTLDLAGNQVTGNYTLGFTVYYYQVEHLVPGIRLYCTCRNFLIQGCISTEKQLLSGLTPGVESTAYLYTTEGTVGKISAILTCKRNSLGHTLVDNSSTHFCKTINICLAGAVVATLYRIIKETINGIIIILIVLGSIYTSLCGNRVCAAGRIADTENFNVVTKFSKGCSCRSSSKTCTYYDNFKFPFVVRTYQMNFRLAFSPFFSQRSFRNFR